MNMNKMKSAFLAGLLALVALAAAGCGSDWAQKWDDPVYFGDEDELGKGVNGSGTGSETWTFDNW